MSYKILVAEDDDSIVDLLKLYLENEGYGVYAASDGLQALKILESNRIDLAVLDIMMPKLNGYEVTKRIRNISNIPILILSAKNLDSDKIIGLELGADDYLTKPFNPLEIIARVKAALRRYYKLNDNTGKENIAATKFKVGELELDTERLELLKNGKEIALTPTEYRIIALLMKAPGRVYTKAQIYETISGEYFESDDNTMMVHISKLREKIEKDPKSPEYIKTIRGLGYKIEKR
ncbi:response regulator transcription factor [Aminipila sp.]|uniref:response regulator transcription factor n=2 Tax=Aminipila sp. TaxID=2060095 RepID=UPI0028A19BD5|nr:response regulator transcription factor [Aminipila sp.]